jgi:predicted transcriptional regulator
MGDFPQQIVVAVGPDETLDDVVARLRQAGVQITQVLPATGVVTGSVAASRLTDVGLVDGVIAVEPSRSIELPPPDAPQ